ncbi:3-oxoacyl-ACP synthase [Flavobacteriaceae bacterium S356]|uniref:3-oxoacyl-ACP synthase n=1 Tax=Asprobacillus argus TaxID=3076534 RepID=A0ABU3LC98_9FLAO|nr:3-oxoacyl-ACP synthase [Flavobacteriaceae bacterium S356]
MNIKQKLYKRCEEIVDHRLLNIENTIASHRKALNSETKSSAGDKHETGRAMLQLEMEKAGQQLVSVQQMKETLAKIDISRESNIVSLGALIGTNTGNYFLSISAGQMQIEKTTYFAISTSSPIGKLLLGKKEGEGLFWNGRKIKIHTIS